ncbi:MAG: hypothetical protein BGO98_35635 [Myxococcales bacterium 68-20]|nr:MAG: hypothetical protein BGO98_35635 [Myxococcales bacterium 68-20]
MSRRVRVMLWMLGVPAAVSGVAAGCANAEEQWHETTPSLEDGGVVPTVPDDAAVVPEDPDGDAPDVLEPTRACSYDHWCPTPLPKSVESPKKYDLRAVWVAPNHEAFAASYGGDVLAWDGVAWKEIYADGPRFLRIWGASTTELWLVTETQRLFRGTKNAANVWSFAEVPTPGPVSTVWGASASEVWASGAGLFRWNGEAAAEPWTEVTPPTTLSDVIVGGRIYSLWGTGPNDFWGSGAQWSAPCFDCDGPQRALLVRWDPNAPATELDAGVEPVADGGASARRGAWKAVALDPRGNIDFYQAKASGSAGGQAQVMCRDRYCLQTLHAMPVDGSPDELSFSVFPVVMVADRAVNAIWGSRPDDVWLVGKQGSVSHFDGTAWSVSRITNTDTPIARPMYSVHGITDGTQSDVWVVGNNITLHRTVTQ